jgi:LuxR family maltose regulon positive regulatory protein
MKEAADWAVSIVFPEGAWERSLYDAFPVVMRVYFAERRWTEALSLLDRFSRGLDRPATISTLTYLAQYLVALHHAGQNEQAHEVAARLFALTEPEGYLRVYLDEGEPMRQALLALLNTHSQQHELAPSTRAYISKLLAVFEQERQGAGTLLSAHTPRPALPSALQASAGFSAPAALTRREQEVLRLLATGASNQEIAQTLVIELPTVKKHVSNLLGKLGATSRTQAIALARARSLL